MGNTANTCITEIDISYQVALPSLTFAVVTAPLDLFFAIAHIHYIMRRH
jgi:hypothetical protein